MNNTNAVQTAGKKRYKMDELEELKTWKKLACDIGFRENYVKNHSQLLEACKAIQSAYARTDNGKVLARAKAVKLANAAIAKAEGRE